MISVSAVVLGLSACATAEPSGSSVMERTASDTSSDSREVEIVQAPVSDTDIRKVYSDMTRMTDGANVQIFSLDNDDFPAPAASDDPSAYAYAPVDEIPEYQSKVYTGDSSVTIFPLDAGNPPVRDARVPGVLPPSHPLMSSAPQPLQPVAAADHSAERIYFGHGVTTLDQSGADTSKLLATRCSNGSCGIVKVEGHASTRAVAKDEIQRRLINLKISMERAMNVSRELIRDGIPAQAIQTTAFGDTMPATVPHGSDDESAARRVEVKTVPVSPLQY
jgi:outer membrane protein OmpA-like peptidoglycan-associated protein